MENSKKSLKQFYENLAELEDIGYYFHPIGIERRQKVLTLLDPGEKDRVVDLGCGDGNISKYLVGEVRAIWGVDISTKRVRRATQKGIKAICGDVRSTPFSSNYFDKVICPEIIEHVISPEKLLREIRRLLKDDGFAVMTVPINQKLKTTLIEVPKEDLAHMTYQEIKDKHDVVDDHLHSFSEESFTQLLKQEKFNILSTNYTHGYELRYGKLGNRFLRPLLSIFSNLATKNPISRKYYQILFEKIIPLVYKQRKREKRHLIVKITKM